VKASPATDGSEPALRLGALTKRYPGGTAALSGVDLTVPRGQVLALIGPSGAGKSTLIRCVNRLVEPSQGRVFLGATEVTALRGKGLRAARRRIGMIFQEYALVERLTVMENVLSGSLGRYGFWRSALRRFPAEGIQRAFELLGRVGLQGMQDKRADQLSGGERQRVGIARALHQEPELLLVDEPTASLDPRTSLRVMRLIVELCRERALTAVSTDHPQRSPPRGSRRSTGRRSGRRSVTWADGRFLRKMRNCGYYVSWRTGSPQPISLATWATSLVGFATAASRSRSSAMGRPSLA
jgi:phosphonate transport system ATP-binding protein